MARRGLLFAMVIGCLLLAGMPASDVVGTSRLGEKTILFGPGNILGGTGVGSMALGDLDSDGDLDIVSASMYSRQVTAWENDGSPFSEPWTQQEVGTASEDVLSVALGDLDNDGDLDIVSGPEFYDATVWENDGTPFTGQWNHNDVGTARQVALADLDNDGDLDIVTGSAPGLSAWENDGSPFSGAWTGTQVGASNYVSSVAAGDLDNDGDADIVSGMAIPAGGEIVAWHNDGTPFSDPWSQQDVGVSTAAVLSVALGDLDNDGDMDVVSSSNPVEDYELISWENDGTPFDDPWNQNDVSVAWPSSLALGDLDGDGDLDIVSGDGLPPDYEGGEVLAWENDGSPFAGLWSRRHVGEGTIPVVVAVGDLDDDGDLDVVSGRYYWSEYPDAVVAWQNTSSYGNWVPFVAKRFPYHCDNFSDPTTGWYVGGSANVKYGYVDGEYEILLRKKSWMGAVTAPIGGLTNGSIEADMHLHQGTKGAYGLIFGLQDWDHFYLFLVDPGIGYYSLWRAKPDDWVKLVNWTYSPYIFTADAVNHLKVERNGDEIVLRANGHLLKETSDDKYIGNLRVGLLAITWDEAPIAVRSDNFCAQTSETAALTEGISMTMEGETTGGRGPLPPPTP